MPSGSTHVRTSATCLRIAHESDAAKLTPLGWKQHFAAQVEAHRNSILERIVNALA